MVLLLFCYNKQGINCVCDTFDRCIKKIGDWLLVVVNETSFSVTFNIALMCSDKFFFFLQLRSSTVSEGK